MWRKQTCKIALGIVALLLTGIFGASTFAAFSFAPPATEKEEWMREDNLRTTISIDGTMRAFTHVLVLTTAVLTTARAGTSYTPRHAHERHPDYLANTECESD